MMTVVPSGQPISRTVIFCPPSTLRRAPALLLFGARAHLHAGDGGDGRQRLAAKAERADIVELRRVCQLGGGVVFKGQAHLPRLDAAARCP